MFLRGHGGDSAGLGEYQGDAIRNITGTISGGDFPGAAGDFAELFGDCLITSDGAFTLGDYKEQQGVGNVGWGSGSRPRSFTFDASRQVPVASENRPVNKAVKYIIKAR